MVLYFMGVSITDSLDGTYQIARNKNKKNKKIVGIFFSNSSCDTLALSGCSYRDILQRCY